MTPHDEAHERAVEAAAIERLTRTLGDWHIQTRWSDLPADVRQSWIDGTARDIDTYLQSLADQGDPLVRVSEVVEFLRHGSTGKPERDRYREALESIVVNLDGQYGDGNIFPSAALRIATDALGERRNHSPEDRP